MVQFFFLLTGELGDNIIYRGMEEKCCRKSYFFEFIYAIINNNYMVNERSSYEKSFTEAERRGVGRR